MRIRRRDLRISHIDRSHLLEVPRDAAIVELQELAAMLGHPSAYRRGHEKRRLADGRVQRRVICAAEAGELYGDELHLAGALGVCRQLIEQKR
jgi:hypothetical protein